VTIHETLASQQTEIFRSEMERQREWEENMLRAEREENARLLQTITQTFFQNISILLHRPPDMPSFGNTVTTFPPNLHVQQLFVGYFKSNCLF
jgi:hypothetical protein